MKIAVVGAGVSGLVCARLLATRHDVQLFEAAEYVGGHANTVDVEWGGQVVNADTGFMVFNERTYPNFTRMLRLLGIATQPSDMSLSVRCTRCGLEYQGSSWNGLFAQRANLRRPAFWRMLADILRFNRHSVAFLREADDTLTLEQFLARHRYGRQFVEHYLVPMGAAIWSAPPATFLGIPARFLLGFFHNHGLLQIRDRPQWRTIVGGSRTYVDALARPLGRRMRLATPIRSVRRHDDRVTIALDCGETESFDKVVLATHADATRAMLDDPSDEERSLLSAFDYQRNEAVLHTDQAWLPARRRAWASWNYHLRSHGDEAASVTYDLNRLQRLGGRNPLLLTLNPSARIAPANTLRSFVYRHPVFGKRSVAAQRVAHRISGVRRTYYCGAYWGHGFHEDGVNSALAACRQFGIGLEACTVACTKGASGITVAAQ